jgi:quercetin dioxygenase-like cupin family protein
VHTGLSVAELRPGGTLGLHVHSFEEGFYVLSGEAIVQINDTACRVASGDYGGSEASHV